MVWHRLIFSCTALTHLFDSIWYDIDWFSVALLWLTYLILYGMTADGSSHLVAQMIKLSHSENKEHSFANILKGKRNAYSEFQNVGFIIRTNFVLIPAIYTHWYRQLNSSTNLFNFCWWRIPLAMTSLPRIGMHRLYAKEPRARKHITFEGNGSLNNFPL